MALTELQRSICRLLASSRVASGESYVAGGVALNELLGAPRLSRDIDLFHDTEAALAATWAADRQLLAGAGYSVRVLRERVGLVEAEVAGSSESVRIEWARDSSFRFFPLVTHEELGLTLHPFDLATNKVLALVGRLEVRDWIDVVECDSRLQPLGYLAWAACGKDPGFNPVSILEHASRTAHYSAAEIAVLSFAGEPPDMATFSRRWREALETAREVVAALPAEEIGRCVLNSGGDLCRLTPSNFSVALQRGEMRFHAGSIRGALPQLLLE